MKLTKSRLKQIIKEELVFLGALETELNFAKKHGFAWANAASILVQEEGQEEEGQEEDKPKPKQKAKPKPKRKIIPSKKKEKVPSDAMHDATHEAAHVLQHVSKP